MKEKKHHPFSPIYDANSEILILGSFPSVKSRENGFYYGHPQNRFWPLIAKIKEADTPIEMADKIGFLLKHHIALWDILSDCEISGSADSSISSPLPHDIPSLLKKTKIRKIICNGKKSFLLFKKFFPDLCTDSSTEIICLSSTSPANAAKSLDALYDIWYPHF